VVPETDPPGGSGGKDDYSGTWSPGEKIDRQIITFLSEIQEKSEVLEKTLNFSIFLAFFPGKGYSPVDQWLFGKQLLQRLIEQKMDLGV